MRPNRKHIWKILLGLGFLLFCCEFLIYFIVIAGCNWPTLDPSKEEPSIIKTLEEPLKAIFIADPHLLGYRKGHWFDKLRREWQMHRAFQTAIWLHQPDVVFVLGDLLDEGSFCSSAEFYEHVERFFRLFAVPPKVKMYFAVGNHDIGFHYGVHPYLTARFMSAFNTSSIQLVSLKGIHFVLVNSMALEGDGCFLCHPAEKELSRIEKILKCSKFKNSNCDHKSTLDIYSRPILLQHYPLYRKSDAECTDPDAAPPSIREQTFREGWECISKEATFQILRQIQPRLAVSGHTHHGCTKPLPYGDGMEITIPSFSWRNKDNPNFGMGIFTTNNYAFSKCSIPSESAIIGLYVIGILTIGFWLYYSSRR